MQAARFSRSRLWLALSATAFLFAVPAIGRSQDYPPPQNPERPYVSSWQDLRQLSLQLESQAMRTRDEAKMDQRSHGSEELAEKIDDFAKDAHQLRLYATERNVPVSQINDRIRKLIDDAHNVQKEQAKAKRRDPQTDEDWNRTVALLHRVNNQFLAANGLATGAVGTSGSDTETYRYTGTWADNRMTMLSDLERRAEDAARASESASLDVTPEIDRLRDQVRSFRQASDSLSTADTRANIARLLADARAAQADLAGSNASPRLRDDINAMVGTLVQMRDLAGEPVGTSGYGMGPGVASERYDMMDVPQLNLALNRRLARASDLASQAEVGDVGDDIARFRDKAADFENNAASMSPQDRRDTAGHLLQDAQHVQRELADHNAPAELLNQWNAVVDIVARLRDAS